MLWRLFVALDELLHSRALQTLLPLDFLHTPKHIDSNHLFVLMVFGSLFTSLLPLRSFSHTLHSMMCCRTSIFGVYIHLLPVWIVGAWFGYFFFHSFDVLSFDVVYEWTRAILFSMLLLFAFSLFALWIRMNYAPDTRRGLMPYKHHLKWYALCCCAVSFHCCAIVIM